MNMRGKYLRLSKILLKYLFDILMTDHLGILIMDCSCLLFLIFSSFKYL